MCGCMDTWSMYRISPGLLPSDIERVPPCHHLTSFTVYCICYSTCMSTSSSPKCMAIEYQRLRHGYCNCNENSCPKVEPETSRFCLDCPCLYIMYDKCLTCIICELAAFDAIEHRLESRTKGDDDDDDVPEMTSTRLHKGHNLQLLSRVWNRLEIS